MGGFEGADGIGSGGVGGGGIGSGGDGGEASFAAGRHGVEGHAIKRG